jgi:hypothetical protein
MKPFFSRLMRSRWCWVCVVIGAASLYPQWYYSAYPRGVLAAHIDHARGRHEVQLIGYPCPWDEEYCSLLRGFRKTT